MHTQDSVEKQSAGVVSSPAQAVPSDFRKHQRTRFLEDLYRKYSGELVGWLTRRYGGGPPPPEEVVQITFAKIAEIEDFSRIQNPRAYLYMTAVNATLMQIRQVARNRKFIEASLHETGERLEEITPERIYEERERLSRLMEAIDRLPQRQRELVRRCRILGQTYEQIRAETGWSLADISRQLSAAMVTLTQAAKDDDDNEEN